MRVLVLALVVGLLAPALARGAPAEDAALRAEYDRVARLRRAGRPREAALAFEALANSHPDAPIAQRALATAAQIHHWNLDDHEAAKALYDRVLLGPPDGPGVASAIRGRLALARAEAGAEGELSVLRTLLARKTEPDLAAYMRIRAAKILGDELGDREGAIKQLAAVRTLQPDSSRADQAAMLEASYLRALHRPREALALYRALIDTASTSLIVGDYDSTYLDDAYFAIGETLRLELRDSEAAEGAYLELVKARPLSRLVDDALHQAAELAEGRGDVAAARALRARLAALAPASRYRAEAKPVRSSTRSGEVTR